MTKAFMMKLDKIQPSQLYINSEKLSRIMKAFDPSRIETLKPIPIKKLEGEVIYTDGHTRALAAFTSGFREIRVFWDIDKLDWEAYGICVEWCKKEGIRTIADLKNRIVAKQEYEALWLDRCKEMQEDLEEKRKRNSLKRDQKPGLPLFFGVLSLYGQTNRTSSNLLCQLKTRLSRKQNGLACFTR